MLTLAIDTATVVCAALARDGEVLADERIDDTRAHVEELMPLIQRLARTAGVQLSDLDQVMVGIGPGPFTGLRVGVVTGFTLAELAGLTPRGVCSLDVLARAHAETRPDGDFLTVIDARRHELYWARHSADGRRIAGPFVGASETLPDLPRVDGPLQVAWLAQDPDWFVDAGLEPLYLRAPDAAVATTRKSALNTGRRLKLKKVGS